MTIRWTPARRPEVDGGKTWLRTAMGATILHGTPLVDDPWNRAGPAMGADETSVLAILRVKLKRGGRNCRFIDLRGRKDSPTTTAINRSGDERPHAGTLDNTHDSGPEDPQGARGHAGSGLLGGPESRPSMTRFRRPKGWAAFP